MTFKQRLHLQNLHEQKRAKYQATLNNALSYDLDFYRFKNGKLNVSKMARYMGVSHAWLEKELYKKGI